MIKTKSAGFVKHIASEFLQSYKNTEAFLAKMGTEKMLLTFRYNQ